MCKTIRLASPLTFDSIVDGPGLRCVLWTQGCPHGCEDCHNPQTWDVQGGYIEQTQKLVDDILKSKLQSGLTISGGEPLLQVDSLLTIVKPVKEAGFTIWMYSGYTWEQIIKDDKKKRILPYLDVLIDGKFMKEYKSYELVFKGSKNQRIIDVKQSLKEDKVVLVKEDAESGL